MASSASTDTTSSLPLNDPSITVDADVNSSDTTDTTSLKPLSPTNTNSYVYYLLNKPPKVLTTCSVTLSEYSLSEYIESKRTGSLILHYLPPFPKVFPVGRLDFDSEGIILLTNDGEFSNYICQPNSKIEKIYHVLICERSHPWSKQTMSSELLKVMVDGVTDKQNNCTYKAKAVRILDYDSNSGYTLLEVTLDEGKNREIRRVVHGCRFKVVVLRRMGIGGLGGCDGHEEGRGGGEVEPAGQGVRRELERIGIEITGVSEESATKEEVKSSAKMRRIEKSIRKKEAEDSAKLQLLLDAESPLESQPMPANGCVFRGFSSGNVLKVGESRVLTQEEIDRFGFIRKKRLKVDG